MAPWVVLVGALMVPFLSETRPMSHQPFPDAHSYVSEAIQIAEGNGLRIDFDESRSTAENLVGRGVSYPSRYPPALPLLLSPFAFVAGESGIFFGSKVIVALLILAIWVTTRIIGGTVAAMISVVVVAVSPFASDAASLVMSDALGALLTVTVVALLAKLSNVGDRLRYRPSLLFLAGVVSSLALVSRVALVVVPVALLWVSRRISRWHWLILGLIPALVFLAVYQMVEFGAPWRTGYDYYEPDRTEFSFVNIVKSDPLGDRSFLLSDRLDGKLMSWSCPCDEFGPMGQASNIVFYPALLLGMYWVYFPPFFSLFASMAVWRRRSESSVKFGVLVSALCSIGMAFYYYQGARLVAPVAVVLLVFGSVGFADFARLLRSSIVRFRVQQPAQN